MGSLFKIHTNGAILIFIATFFCVASDLRASGYTTSQNDQIWNFRKAANITALENAARECKWRPSDGMTFDDDFIQNNNVQDKELERRLMSWLRHDQNARAVYKADPNKASLSRLQDVDRENLVNIRLVVDNHFPSTKEVGISASNAALMLVIHADKDLSFQKAALQKIKAAAASGLIPSSFPIVLQTVRPAIANAQPSQTKLGGNAESDATPKTGESCFYHSYLNDFNHELSKYLVGYFVGHNR